MISMKKQPTTQKSKRLLFDKAGEVLHLKGATVKKIEAISDAQVALILSTFKVYVAQAEATSKNREALVKSNFSSKSLQTIGHILKDAQRSSKHFASFKKTVNKA